MAKYTPEFKLEIVKKVIEDGRPAGTVAKEYQVNKGDVQAWTAVYQAHGMAGLEKKKGTYTGAFKQKVIEDMHTNKLSLRETAVKYNLGQHYAVSAWERIYFEEGPEGLYKERRGRVAAASGTGKGRPPKLEKKVEEDLIAEVQRLRAENDYLKKFECLGIREGTAREKAQIVTELRQKHKLDVLLGVAELSRATYYYHLKRSATPDKYSEIKRQILLIYTENKQRVGYRRITVELHNKGVCINHKTVQRLMKQLGLFCRVRMKKYKSYRGEIGKIAPNLLDRNFEAEKPNRKWVTDVTEFALFGQKLYLSTILDLYSRDIVSYTISKHPNFGQVMEMLEQAFQKLPDGSDLILHSDQGWQYQMKLYQRILNAKGIRQSMRRKVTALIIRSWRTSSEFLRVNCFICKILPHWTILSRNSSIILITTTIVVSR